MLNEANKNTSGLITYHTRLRLRLQINKPAARACHDPALILQDNRPLPTHK